MIKRRKLLFFDSEVVLEDTPVNVDSGRLTIIFIN